MDQIEIIRKTTGIGQPALAGFLGLTKQALAKVENGLCRLSTNSLLKLVRLEKCLDSPVLSSSKKQISPAEKEECIKREEDRRFLAVVLERKLARAEEAAKKLERLNQALSQLVAIDKGEEIWIERTKISIRKKLSTCRRFTGMRIRKRIFLLNAEAEFLNSFVNENVLESEK